MKRAVATVLSAISIHGLQAQDRPPQPALNCAAADAGLGGAAPSDAQERIRIYYSPRTNRTYITVNERGQGGSSIHASVSWAGAGQPEGLAAQLDVSVPGSLLKTPITPSDTLLAVIDDSLRFDLGTPTAATISFPPSPSAPRVPRSVPLSTALSSGSFLAIAKASSMVLTFRSTRIKASRAALTALNALYRAMICAGT